MSKLSLVASNIKSSIDVRSAGRRSAPGGGAGHDAATLAAIGKSQAMIEFEPDGTIIWANENFVGALGYGSLEEIKGKHHSTFVDPAYGQSVEYAQFWEKLRAGEFQAGAFRRVRKDGQDIWIQAAYNPVVDASGKVVRVVKNAVDITAETLAKQEADAENQRLVGTLDAIGKSQAMIEFEPDGTIVWANKNFVAALGYGSLEEIKGKHHRTFVDPTYGQSAEYTEFWGKLRAGEFQAGSFRRVRKDGQDIWIQAAYNPVVDDSGQVVRVVKNAVDITAETLAKQEADAENQRLVGTLDAIGRSQAMIEFEPDGTIVWANENFINALGYGGLGEIKGRHHSTFVDPAYGQSAEYTRFWEKLRAGEFQAGVFKRVCKDGKDIWIQAAYNPVVDADGNVVRVVKNAVDITAERLEQQGLADGMKQTVQVVAAAAQEMRTTAQSMSATAEQTNKQSMAVASASEQAAQNVQTVASAAEELSASIGEISRQVAKSNDISQSAVTQAEETNDTVQGLSAAAQKIGDVVDLINDIASQTNLLALNATIEAARAGEAGKGFAVVASEVKNLASQTAKATGEIGAQIADMQTVTTDAVSAIETISKTISHISEIASTISAAVEEQSAATSEISQNVAQAAVGTNEVSSNIAGVTTAANEAGQAAEQVLGAVNMLAEEGDRMRGVVDDFLAKIA